MHLGIVHGPIENSMIFSTPEVGVNNTKGPLLKLDVRNNRNLCPPRLIKDNDGPIIAEEDEDNMVSAIREEGKSE